MAFLHPAMAHSGGKKSDKMAYKMALSGACAEKVSLCACAVLTHSNLQRLEAFPGSAESCVSRVLGYFGLGFWFLRFSLMMSNVSMDSSSWSFSSKGFHNTAEIDPFSAVYALKKQNWTGRWRNAIQSFC